MLKNQLISLLLMVLIPLFLPGQCPDKQKLWERINCLKDSKLSSSEQLAELLKIEDTIKNCHYRFDSTRVLLLQRLSKLWLNTGGHSQAIFYLKEANKILSENLNALNISPDNLIKGYYIQASIYNSLNKTLDRIKALNSCIRVARKLDRVTLYSLNAQCEKVLYLNNIGEYDLCIKYADVGDQLSRHFIPEKGMKIYGDATVFKLRFAIEKVNALLAINKTDAAEKILLAKIAESDKPTAKKFLGSLYEQLAMTQMQKKRYKEVIQNFDKALMYNSKQDYQLSCKANMHNIGYLIYDEIYRNDNKALYYYRTALDYVNVDANLNKLDSIISLRIFSNIADIYVRKNWFDSAHFYYQRAFDQIKSGTNETEVVNSSLDEFIKNQKVEYLIGLFISKGDAYYKEYQSTKDPVAVKNAVRVYKLTDRLLERIKTGQSELPSQLFWRKDTHHLYEQAIEACLADGKKEDAFYFSERSRSILLTDQIIDQRLLSVEEINKLRELSIRLKVKEKEIRLAPLDSESALKQWYDLKDEQIVLKQLARERQPSSPQFQGINFNAYKDIYQHNLHHRQTFVEFFAGESMVYAIIILGKKMYFNKINKKEYDSTVNLCISYMSDPGVLNRNHYFTLFAKTSRHLYDLIFQQVKIPAGRMVVSPDGRYFPFEALVTRMNGNEPVYFLENHAVSYTYSAHYLTTVFHQPSEVLPQNFMGIAPVKFPVKWQLPDLMSSDESVKKLESYFIDSYELLGERATKKNFLNRFGQYQIIQLYTHSSDSSSEGEPVIYFADEPLYLSELNNLKLPVTRLVVLSACKTGSGEFYQGEGVFSFNRAFAALGIASCITNLWSIDNQSTYQLTELFYQKLSEGLPIDVALQQAKIQFIKTSSGKGRLPYHWAASILAGKTDFIEFKKKSTTWMFPVFGAGIGFLVLLILLVKKRKKKLLQSKAL